MFVPRLVCSFDYLPGNIRDDFINSRLSDVMGIKARCDPGDLPNRGIGISLVSVERAPLRPRTLTKLYVGVYPGKAGCWGIFRFLNLNLANFLIPVSSRTEQVAAVW